MAEHDRTQAEEACQRADELFRYGDIRGARREASAAKRLCPSLPAAASALACYDIHAARPGDWRAVLGMAPGVAATRDAVKRHFRQMSLLVHPDKNRSCAAAAAADGAFKLLRRALDDALLAASLSGDCEGRYAARDDVPRQQPSPRRTREWREQERRRKEERRRWRQEPICPYKVIHCPFCDHDFVRLCGPLQEQRGTACRHCGRWLSPPWQKKPEPATATPRPEEEFPCPARCPECGTQYAAIVSVAKWCLRCKACGKKAVVDVRGPDRATATKTGRP